MLDAKEWIGPSEAARVLGVSSQRVRQLADSGELMSTRTRLGRLFDPRDVDQLAETRRRRGVQLIGAGKPSGGPSTDGDEWPCLS